MELSYVIKKRSKAILVLALFIFTALIVSRYIFPQVINSKNDAKPDGTNSGGSVFENVGKSRREELVDDMKEFFIGGDQNYWKDWNYKDKVIFAHIQEINLIDNDIVALISPPPHEAFSNRRWSLHVMCPEDNTIAISENYTPDSVVAYNFDLLSQAKVGDVLIGYCLEEDCLNIGSKCYLIEVGRTKSIDQED